MKVIGRFRRFLADPVFAIVLVLVLLGLGALGLLAGRAVAYVAFALSALVLAAWALDWFLHQRDARLRERCRRLSDEIMQFLSDRRRDDPGSIPHWFGLSATATEEEKTRAFNDSTAKSMRYSTETISRYNERYLARSLALFDDLAERNLAPTANRMYFEHPTNPLGIEEVARTLGAIGHRMT
jgi:hypothetical protein